jgi:integrase
VLIFGEPKTKKGARVISLDADTITALRSHKAAQAAERLVWGPAYNSHDLVFCREDGSPLHPDQVSRLFIALSEAAGLPRIVFHGLRHTHATHAHRCWRRHHRRGEQARSLTVVLHGGYLHKGASGGGQGGGRRHREVGEDGGRERDRFRDSVKVS